MTRVILACACAVLGSLMHACDLTDRQSFVMRTPPDVDQEVEFLIGDVVVREAHVLSGEGSIPDLLIVVTDVSDAARPQTTTTICYATERSTDGEAAPGYRSITLVTHQEDTSLGDARAVTRERGYWGVDLEDADGRRIRGLIVLCWEKRPLSRGGLLDPYEPGFEERLTEVRMIVVDTLTTNPLRKRDRTWFIDSDSIEDEPLVYLRLAQNETSDPVWQKRIATSIERRSGGME